MDFTKIAFVTGLTAEAKLPLAAGFMAAAGGGTPSGAARACERLIGQGAQALISFGFAGGLRPALQGGALIVPDDVLYGGERFPCDPALLSWLGPAQRGTMLAAEGIAASVAAKAALFQTTQADAVDLESGAVARAARSLEIPFAVLRAISDPAGRALPPAALVTLDATGRISPVALLKALLREPKQIPALMALGKDTATARAALRTRLRQLKRSV